MNTILKDLIPEWNLESYDPSGASEEKMELLDQVVDEVLESMEYELINFEEDYD